MCVYTYLFANYNNTIYTVPSNMYFYMILVSSRDVFHMKIAVSSNIGTCYTKCCFAKTRDYI